jgi:sulfide:quinone oxidoreductase
VAQSVAAELQGEAPAAFNGLGYCWVEMGAGQAGFAVGDFYAEPNPDVRLRTPGRLWHVGKVLFEHAWMGRGADRAVAALGLALGGRALGVPEAV